MDKILNKLLSTIEQKLLSVISLAAFQSLLQPLVIIGIESNNENSFEHSIGINSE